MDLNFKFIANAVTEKKTLKINRYLPENFEQIVISLEFTQHGFQGLYSKSFEIEHIFYWNLDRNIK